MGCPDFKYEFLKHEDFKKKMRESRNRDPNPPKSLILRMSLCKEAQIQHKDMGGRSE